MDAFFVLSPPEPVADYVIMPRDVQEDIPKDFEHHAETCSNGQIVVQMCIVA